MLKGRLTIGKKYGRCWERSAGRDARTDGRNWRSISTPTWHPGSSNGWRSGAQCWPLLRSSDGLMPPSGGVNPPPRIAGWRRKVAATKSAACDASR